MTVSSYKDDVGAQTRVWGRPREHRYRDHVTLPQAEEHQGSAAATRAAAGETRDGSAFEPQGADPADTLISDFSPPEL